MSDDPNGKYRILDTTVEGVIHSMEPLVPYAGGSASLRNIVVFVDAGVNGAPAKTYVPLTLFGPVALELDPRRDLNRQISCVARLTSKRYTDRNGNPRWGLSLSAWGAKLGGGPGQESGDEGQDRSDQYRPREDYDDLPF